MKIKWIILAFSLFLMGDLLAKQYKIIAIRNPEHIKIGGRVCHEGSLFDDGEIIDWQGDGQYMAIQSASSADDQRTQYVTKVSMSSKKAKTVKDYLFHTGKLSGKDGENWLVLPAKNTGNFTDKRIALVIGNSNYENNTPLRNPCNDATAVSVQLQQLGFDVFVLYDGSYEEMEYVTGAFCRKSFREFYDMAVFYYSGHGLQYDGVSWLLPIDALLLHPTDLKGNCMDVNTLLTRIEETKCTNTVVVLDACRTEKMNWTDEKGKPVVTQPQSVSVEPPIGMLLAYSTRSGEISQDLTDKDAVTGPYAMAFTKALAKQNLNLDELFAEVRTQVLQLTSSSQMPLYTNASTNTVVINGKNAIVPRAAIGQQYGEQSSAYLNYVIEKAEQGDSEAQFQMGKCYEYGTNDLHEDYATAVQWYQKSADQGHAEAQNKIGTYHFRQKNYKEAMKYYGNAAAAGSANARYNMGMLYMNGEYGLYDVEKGLRCYQLAAESGLVNAQFELGLCYYNNIGGANYRTQAILWFERAASQGYDEAQFMLGHCYFTGDCTEKNYKKAFSYYKMAADQNYAPAQYGLSLCYEKGYGVEKNLSQAIYWCKKAAAQDYEKAVQKLKVLQPSSH